MTRFLNNRLANKIKTNLNLVNKNKIKIKKQVKMKMKMINKMISSRVIQLISMMKIVRKVHPLILTTRKRIKKITILFWILIEKFKIN